MRSEMERWYGPRVRTQRPRLCRTRIRHVGNRGQSIRPELWTHRHRWPEGRIGCRDNHTGLEKGRRRLPLDCPTAWSGLHEDIMPCLPNYPVSQCYCLWDLMPNENIGLPLQKKQEKVMFKVLNYKAFPFLPWSLLQLAMVIFICCLMYF